MSGVIVIASAILAFSLVSGRLKEGIITPPMVFAAFGLAVGGAGLALVDIDISHSTIHVLAEITLVLILFSDAARIDLGLLIRDHNLPIRMLLIAMPLIVLLGAVLAYVMPLGLSWAEAALLAAVLAPTDAALGQSVVSNPKVPVRIRQALNVESGLNDGLAVPFVFLFAALASGSATGSDTSHHVGFALAQITLGPLVGIAVGWSAARLMDQAVSRAWMASSFEGAAVLAAAALAYAAADAIGGNGFIAAFTAGLLFGFTIKGRCKFLLEFAESEGQLLTLLSFLVFGAAMLPEVAAHVSWAMILYALLSLTVIRMLPVAVSLIGTGISTTTIGFLGWFGPRGLASILFGLIVIERMNVPAAGTILTITVLTVALSIVLHGLSAAPFARLYGDAARAMGDCAESHAVSDMPTRFGRHV